MPDSNPYNNQIYLKWVLAVNLKTSSCKGVQCITKELKITHENIKQQKTEFFFHSTPMWLYGIIIFAGSGLF
jgi:hypothetical protein